jgi:hypothetical protein
VKVAGSLSLREVAVDADMSDTLPWLRVGHADDELFASVLELRWRTSTPSWRSRPVTATCRTRPG